MFPVFDTELNHFPPYPLQILENTPENHPDHSHLKHALEKAEELCSQVNEGVREKENSDRLEWIQAHVQCEGLSEVNLTLASIQPATLGMASAVGISNFCNIFCSSFGVTYAPSTGITCSADCAAYTSIFDTCAHIFSVSTYYKLQSRKLSVRFDICTLCCGFPQISHEGHGHIHWFCPWIFFARPVPSDGKITDPCTIN